MREVRYYADEKATYRVVSDPDAQPPSHIGYVFTGVGWRWEPRAVFRVSDAGVTELSRAEALERIGAQYADYLDEKVLPLT